MTDTAQPNPVRDARGVLGVSTKEFARLLNVYPSSVYRWEQRGEAPRDGLAEVVVRQLTSDFRCCSEHDVQAVRVFLETDDVNAARWALFWLFVLPPAGKEFRR